MHVKHFQTHPYRAQRSTHPETSDTSPRREPPTLLRPPVTSADATPRRAAGHARGPRRLSS
jgi:hypothetical protein